MSQDPDFGIVIHHCGYRCCSMLELEHIDKFDLHARGLAYRYPGTEANSTRTVLDGTCDSHRGVLASIRKKHMYLPLIWSTRPPLNWGFWTSILADTFTVPTVTKSRVPASAYFTAGSLLLCLFRDHRLTAAQAQAIRKAKLRAFFSLPSEVNGGLLLMTFQNKKRKKVDRME